MTALVKYDAALNAIAEAKAVDELLTIRDSVDALRAAARIANNKQAEIDMAEIRFRAERRVGEMMAAQPKNQGLRGRAFTGSETVPVKDDRPTLAEAGIDKHLADRARKLAAIPETEFNGIVSDWRDRVEGENERVTVNLLRAGEKRMSRDEKEAALAERIRAGISALNQGKFGVVLADPPWRFTPYSRETGMDRAADNHYPTMELADIEALEVPAADDCVLFLWATSPMLPEALRVMGAWGFAYKSQIIWGKDRIGTGYWTRNKHELLLIGTKGNIPAPAPGTQPESLIVAPVSVHSAKPEAFHQIIERLFPNLPKIEMFSRRARDGWHGWGAETEKFDPETGELIESASATVPPEPGTGATNSPAAEPVATDPLRSGSATREDAVPAAGEARSTAARKDVQGSSEPLSDAPAAAPAPVAGASRAAVAAGTQAPPVDTIVAFRAPKPLRPHCQHQDDLSKCGGYGKTHCGECLRAAGLSEVRA